MSTRLLIALCVALLVVIEVLHAKLKPRLTPQDLKQLSLVLKPSKLQGQLAPPFTLRDISGQNFTLADHIGKQVIVLNFFATWCEPCRDEMPELERYFRLHRTQFVFLAIDSKESEETVTAYLRDLRLTFPAAVDSGAVQKLYGVTAYPTTVLIGVNGRVGFYMPGEISNADVAFNGLLNANQRIAGTRFAISQQDYLAETRQVAPPPPVTPSALTGRARRIAARMPCPCGCDKRVAACACHTANSIKRELARGSFSAKSDAQIMTALNRKYCMAGM